MQSLGRYDASGPMRAANAAANAARADAAAAGATAQALRAAGDVAMQYYEANAAAEYDRAMAEFGKHEVKLRTMLKSGPSIDTQRWELPDWVDVPGGRTEKQTDELGRERNVPRRFIPTYEVAEQVYTGSMERVSASIADNIKNPLARQQFARQNGVAVAKGAADVARQQHKFYMDYQAGLIKMTIDDRILAGDEDGASAAIARGVHTGVISPEAGSRMRIEVATRIDQSAYNNLLMTAENPEDVEQVEEYISAGVIPRTGPDGRVMWMRSRLDPDTQWQMLSNANTLMRRAEAERDDRHDRNMQDYTARFIAGKLTRTDVGAAVSTDQVNHTQALTLFRALREKTEKAVAFKPDQAAMDVWRKRIASLRWGQPGERVSQRRREIETDMQAAMSGFYQDGREYDGPRLNGKEHDILIGELRGEEKTVHQAPEYRQAVSMISSLTQFNELLPTPGANAEARAYMDFKLSLDNYVDRYGVEGARQFVMDNSDKFKVGGYAGTDLRRFFKAYSNYKNLLSPEQLNRSGNLKSDIMRDVDELESIKQRVVAEVMRRYQAGEIDEATAQTQMLQLGEGFELERYSEVDRARLQ